MIKTFSQWVAEKEMRPTEACTDTGAIAGFARPVFGVLQTRMYPPPVLLDDEKKKKKKRHGTNLQEL